jgi:hypothetical protein
MRDSYYTHYSAFFPKLNQDHLAGDEVELVETFHTGAQLMAVMMGGVGAVFILFFRYLSKVLDL